MASANSSCSVRSEKFFIARPPCRLLFRQSDAAGPQLRPDAFPWKSGEVKAIQVHHLVPRSHEVAHKHCLRVGTGIDLREGSQLGVRTENEIDTGAGPLQLSRRAIAALKHVPGFRDSLPNRAHVEQVHEEIVGERRGALREDAVLRLSEIRIQYTHAADE